MVDNKTRLSKFFSTDETVELATYLWEPVETLWRQLVVPALRMVPDAVFTPRIIILVADFTLVVCALQN